MILKPELTWCSDEVCTLGESPLWDSASSTLYWIDVVEPAVYACTNDAVRRYPLPKPVASIYLVQSGHLLVALRSEWVWLDLSDGRIAPTGGAWPVSTDERLNDGRCDCGGAIWISTMDRRLKSGIGSIVRIASATDSRAFSSHAILGNGVCFSPDDRFLYFSDTHARAIYRYDKTGLNEGVSAHRELLVQMIGGKGKPDGCAVDTDGCLWSASVGGACIERYSPAGRSIGTLHLPVSHPTHCTFGGSDLRTLFVTTMRYPPTSPAFSDQSMAGRVLAFRVDAQGLPEHRLTTEFGMNHA